MLLHSKEKITSSIRKKRILGLDPGTAITGYGILDCNGSDLTPLDYGCIRIPTTLALEDRYLALFESLNELIALYLPETVVLETQYVKLNPQSALKVGMARGVAIVAARSKKIEIVQYSPSSAKKAVTGSGRASKNQVQGMVQRLLCLQKPPTPFDASDALALAICHSHQLRRVKVL